MSAWMSSDAMVSAIIAAAQRHSVAFPDSRTMISQICADEIGRELLRENCKSLEYRYRHDDGWHRDNRAQAAAYRFKKPDANDWQALKSLDSYDYQSCEHPEYQDSHAKRFVDALEKKLLGVLRVSRDAAYGRKEYKAAQWSLPDEAKSTGPTI